MLLSKTTSPCNSASSSGQEEEERFPGVRSSFLSSQIVTMLPLRVLGVLLTSQDSGASGLVGCDPLTTSRPSVASRSTVVDLSVALLVSRFRVGDGFCSGGSRLELLGLRDGEAVGEGSEVFSVMGR